MFAKFREFISSIDQKKKTNLLVVGFLIGALGLTVVVSQQQTRSRQQAATNGSIQIINPVTGQEFPENRVFNPDAVYLKITPPDGWALASSTNQNLLKKAYAQAPECRQEKTICGQPAYGNCDFYCEDGKAFYDCVQTDNSSCKGTIYASCENSKCPQPTTRPTPVPTSSTIVCSPGGVFDSVLCRRCAPDGSRWGEAGSDFGQSKGSKTWCSCAQRYQPNLYQAECAGSQTPTPTPTPPSEEAPTPTPTNQPATNGGKKLKSITIRNTDSGSGGKPDFTFGPQDEWYGQALNGTLLWGLNKNPGQKTVSVTFTAEEGAEVTTESTSILVFAFFFPINKESVTYISPLNEAVVDLSTRPEGLTFTWDPVPGATFYILIAQEEDPLGEVVDNNCPPVPFFSLSDSGGAEDGFNNIDICRIMTNTSYTVARDKFVNGTYRSVIYAFNDQGHVFYGQSKHTIQGVPNGGPTVTPAGPTPTPIPGTTTISLAVKLRGIGPKGPEGTPEARNNPNPVKTKRDLTLHFYEPGVDAVNDVNSAKRKFITFIQVVYDGNGKFVAKDIVIDKKVTTGDYGIYVKSPRYLPTQIPGTKRITAGAANQIDSLITLEPGDVDGNWLININDYNAYLSCFGKQTNDCVRLVDFNDDGKVDKKEPPPPDFSDYALFSQQFKPPQEPF